MTINLEPRKPTLRSTAQPVASDVMMNCQRLICSLFQQKICLDFLPFLTTVSPFHFTSWSVRCKPFDFRTLTAIAFLDHSGGNRDSKSQPPIVKVKILVAIVHFSTPIEHDVINSLTRSRVPNQHVLRPPSPFGLLPPGSI